MIEILARLMLVSGLLMYALAGVAIVRRPREHSHCTCTYSTECCYCDRG